MVLSVLGLVLDRVTLIFGIGKIQEGGFATSHEKLPFILNLEALNKLRLEVKEGGINRTTPLYF